MEKTERPGKMKKRTKAALVALLVCVVLFSYAGAELFQISERSVISDINKNLDTPHKMLEKKSDMSLGDYLELGGFGISGYFERKYGEIDGEGSFDAVKNQALVYYVTTWPDTVIGSGRVTRLVCADPEYSLYGCRVGGYYSSLERALVGRGFDKTGGNLNGDRYEKKGVRISLEKDSESGRLACFTITVYNSNIFGIQY